MLQHMMRPLSLGALVVALFGAGIDTRADELKVEAAWAPASVGRTGAAVVTLFNGGGSADRLVGSAFPVAAEILVHRSFEEGGTKDVTVTVQGPGVMEP